MTQKNGPKADVAGVLFDMAGTSKRHFARVFWGTWELLLQHPVLVCITYVDAGKPGNGLKTSCSKKLVSPHFPPHRLGLEP